MFHCYVSLPKCISPTRNNPPKKKMDRILDPSHSSIRASISTNPHQFANKTFKKLYYVIISTKKTQLPFSFEELWKTTKLQKKSPRKTKKTPNVRVQSTTLQAASYISPRLRPKILAKPFCTRQSSNSSFAKRRPDGEAPAIGKLPVSSQWLRTYVL